MPISALSDIPEFKALVQLARSRGIELTLFGSVASRIALKDHLEALEDCNLFDLTNYGSDIDLAHTGSTDDTKFLYKAIEETVPLANWFRWSILDRSAMEIYGLFDLFNHFIPLRKFQIDDRHGIQSFFGAFGRFDETSPSLFEFILNTNFDRTPLRRIVRSFLSEPEAMAVHHAAAILLYVAALEDVRDEFQVLGRDPHIEISYETCRNCIDDSIRQLNRIRRSDAQIDYQRIWYRLAALAHRMDRQRLRQVVDDFGMSPLIEHLKTTNYGGAIEHLFAEGSALIATSSAFEKNDYRLPIVPGALVQTDEQSELALSHMLKALTETVSAEKGRSIGEQEYTEPFELSSDNKVVASITGLKLRSGRVPSARHFPPLAQDFLNISFTLPAGKMSSTDAADLGVLVFAQSRGDLSYLPVPASVSRSRLAPWDSTENTRLTITCNIAGLEQELDLSLFVVRKDYEDA